MVAKNVAALAQVHLSSQNFQHTTGRQQILSRLVCLCVCMFVTSVCAYLRVGGEQVGSENGCFVLLVMMVFRFGFNFRRNCACFTNKCRRIVRARQDEAFSSRESLFQTQSFCCDWQLLNLEFAAPDSCFKSLGAIVLSAIWLVWGVCNRSVGFPRTRNTKRSCACDCGRGFVSVGAFFFLLSSSSSFFFLLPSSFFFLLLPSSFFFFFFSFFFFLLSSFFFLLLLPSSFFLLSFFLSFLSFFLLSSFFFLLLLLSSFFFQNRALKLRSLWEDAMF